MSNNDYIENALQVLNDDLSNISQWDVEHGDVLNNDIGAIHAVISLMQYRVAHMHDDHQILDDGHCVCEAKDGEMRSEIL
jgi:hypothetical protein